MKRNAVLKLVLILALYCAGASLLAQDVKYNYDRDANFSEYKSYQWTERRTMRADQLANQDIRRAIEAQLAQKGLQKTEGGGDLYTNLHATENDSVRSSSVQYIFSQAGAMNT